MLKLVLAALAVVAGGIAVAYFVPSASDSTATFSGVSVEGSSADPASMSLAERVQSLERTIVEERLARQLLQDELLYLTEEIESLRELGGELTNSASVASVTDAAPATDSAATRRERFANRNSPEYRVQRLVDAGISPERAAWILQRESQIRMDMMEARYAAQRSGERVNYGALQQAETDAFRNELGAADYERYLEGTGRSTSVVVGSVLDTSPAQNVGIQPGDEIVSYGGTRIYSMSDLNRAMLEGESGETVAAQIVRDGVTMQVAVRRGPLGITAGRGRRR